VFSPGNGGKSSIKTCFDAIIKKYTLTSPGKKVIIKANVYTNPPKGFMYPYTNRIRVKDPGMTTGYEVAYL